MYLVSEVSYEYNDEVYHTGESDGVLPIALYKSEKRAKEEAAYKTVQQVKDLDLYCYGYDIDEVFDTFTLNKLLEQYGEAIIEDDDGYGEEWDVAFKKLLSKNDEKLTDTLINRVLKIKFFKVQEVEVEV